MPRLHPGRLLRSMVPRTGVQRVFLVVSLIIVAVVDGSALSSSLTANVALLLLAGAVVLHTYGELRQSSATFALDFGLAPHAQGQHQGLLSMGNLAGQALSPLILVGLVLSGGRLGFVLLGAWFTLLGLAGPAVARWGEGSRPAAAAEPVAVLVTEAVQAAAAG